MPKQIIKCAGCNKKLVNLYDKETNEVNEKYIMIACPFCGDCSIATETIGKVNMIIFGDYKGYINYIEDVEMNGKVIEKYEVVLN